MVGNAGAPLSVDCLVPPAYSGKNIHFTCPELRASALSQRAPVHFRLLALSNLDLCPSRPTVPVPAPVWRACMYRRLGGEGWGVHSLKRIG